MVIYPTVEEIILTNQRAILDVKVKKADSQKVLSKGEHKLNRENRSDANSGVKGLNNLVCLGQGENNVIYRLGKVGKLWLAIRDQKIFDFDFGRANAEESIESVVAFYEYGQNVPAVVGRAKVNSNHPPYYFLIVEDLTRGGTSDFKPGSKEDRFGTLFAV